MIFSVFSRNGNRIMIFHVPFLYYNSVICEGLGNRAVSGFIQQRHGNGLKIHTKIL